MSLSPRRKSASSLILATIAAAAIVWGLVYFPADSLIRVERRSGPILHEAYVWQRNWDTAVGQAIQRAAPGISVFTALGAKVSFKGGWIDKVVLCIAGSWLKAKDPNEADRFYKELVIRCPKTKLGQEADKWPRTARSLRWFPKVEMDRNKWPRHGKAAARTGLEPIRITQNNGR